MKATNLRQASAVDIGFPYAAKRVTFLHITARGEITQGQGSGKKLLIDRARRGGTLIAVWPGEWRSDVFLIDDLDAATAALS